MIVCSETLFIHIPKTGGTSIRDAILDCGAPCHLVTKVGDPKGNLREKPNTFNPHVSAATLLPSFGPALDNLFTFTFVRNPWDRYVSWWAWRKDGRAFNQFLREILDDVERTNVHPPIPGNPPRQDDYFEHPALYNFVGKFERLSQDWQEVLAQTTLPASSYLQTLNTSKHTHYRDYYDTDLRKLVQQHEPYTIETFNYRF